MPSTYVIFGFSLSTGIAVLLARRAFGESLAGRDSRGAAEVCWVPAVTWNKGLGTAEGLICSRAEASSLRCPDMFVATARSRRITSAPETDPAILFVVLTWQCTGGASGLVSGSAPSKAGGLN